MSFFERFRSTKRLPEAVDLSTLKTDIHSHLLPNLDDGVTSIEESVGIIKELHKLGLKKLIITPHVMGDYYTNTSEDILKSLSSLKSAVKEANIDIELGAAAEYLVDDLFLTNNKIEDLLSFGEKYILIEFSFFQPPANLNSIIFDLQIAGYNVVIAHPERYSYWYHDFEKYENLRNRDVFFQINVTSLGGHYSVPTKKMALKLLEKGMVDFLGSDIHNDKYLQQFKSSLHEKSVHDLINSGKLRNPSI